MMLPPHPEKCQVCAVRHHPGDPHNRDSLYYQMRFYQDSQRFPTWDDAMAHCDAATQAAWRVAVAARMLEAQDQEVGRLNVRRDA